MCFLTIIVILGVLYVNKKEVCQQCTIEEHENSTEEDNSNLIYSLEEYLKINNISYKLLDIYLKYDRYSYPHLFSDSFNI